MIIPVAGIAMGLILGQAVGKLARVYGDCWTGETCHAQIYNAACQYVCGDAGAGNSSCKYHIEYLGPGIFVFPGTENANFAHDNQLDACYFKQKC
jgi:hypothetical protein